MKQFIILILAFTLALSLPRGYVPHKSVLFPDKLGVRDFKHSFGGKVYNGQAAQPGQLPFIVSLGLNNDEGTYFCAGSLIDEVTVLTLASCLDGAVSVEVLAGECDLRITSVHVLPRY